MKVAIEDHSLTLGGEKRQEREEKGEECHRVERRYGTFQRTFSLPATVDTGKVRAEFENGVLRITLPKSEELKAREIPIEVR